jgi:2'-5' RNA ligase
MSGKYLIEIRTGGRVKQRLRKIMHDVADTFDVRAAVDPRPVPHVTLFGPYDTNEGYAVKDCLIDTFEDFDAVPYRIDGFDTFRDSNVVYFDVVPSEELRALRREISRGLRPLCDDYSRYDTNYFHEFHITLAFRDVGGQLDDILEYARSRYDPQFDCYASRITSLRGQSMMWEWDLPRGEYLTSDEATTAQAWEKTEQALQRHGSHDDHDDLVPSPSRFERLTSRWKARLSRNW